MKENPNKKKILIVDDHAIVVEGLTLYLHQEPDFIVCGHAKNVMEGLQAVEEKRPDLIIVDLSLQNSSGLELIKSVKADNPQLPIIVLTMHDETIYAERAIRAGARGYIMKEQSFRKVIDAIRAVFRGERFISEKVKEQLMITAIDPRKVQVESPVHVLSDREFEIFQLIGRGLRPRHISEKLNVSPGTVDSYCKRIRAKLGFVNMTEFIDYATRWLEHNPS